MRRRKVPKPTTALPPPQGAVGATYGWTADGLPLGDNGYIVGEPLRQAQWESSPFACLEQNDELHSSDLEGLIPESVVLCAALWQQG
ncbi:hypothetical protein U1Q18_002499 [Sarracenia purpurea var. burkii]